MTGLNRYLAWVSAFLYFLRVIVVSPSFGVGFEKKNGIGTFFIFSRINLQKLRLKTLCRIMSKKLVLSKADEQRRSYNHSTYMYLLFKFLSFSVVGDSKSSLVSSPLTRRVNISLVVKSHLRSTPITSFLNSGLMSTILSFISFSSIFILFCLAMVYSSLSEGLIIISID